MPLTLHLLREGKPLLVREIGSAPVSIGRDSENAVVLPDPLVSKRHAALTRENDALVLADLGSTHGTFVNGQKVAQARVQPGDEIRIGPYELRLAAVGELVRVEAPPAVAGLGELTAMVGVTDLRAVLETLLERTMKLAAARSGYVVLVRGARLSAVVARRGDEPLSDDGFSRTVCLQAAQKNETVFLSGAEDAAAIESVASLRDKAPRAVLAVPLTDGAAALGVLYLESDRLLERSLREQLAVLDRVSALGGRALAAALERQQIVADQERWRWLVNLDDDATDMTRTCASPRMQKVLELVQRVAREDVTTLILGESGTGKDLTARTIHRLSERRARPFVAINCGAIPRDLIEGELFGAERGAFTGATGRRPGRLELAQGGTLLLDEIGDLPKDLQVKFLRVLENRSFERLGGTETLAWDARVIAATNQDLAAAVARGEFREDLYYRLNVMSLALPPLRERPEDIEPLACDMVLRTNRRFRRKLYGLTPEALAALKRYAWPGNIRELRNVIERAYILEPSDWITLESLPFPSAPVRAPAPAPAGDALPPLADFMRDQERAYLMRALERAGGNVTRAAQLSGLARSAFYKKVRQLGLRAGPELEE